MKRFIFIVLSVIICSLSVNAQDLIVTNDGQAIKAYNMEIAGSSIFYQTSAAANAPIKKLKTSDVMIVKKQDGSKFDPNVDAAVAASENVSANPASGELVITDEIRNENERFISKYNKVLTWKPDEKFIRKKRGEKPGNGFASVFWVREGSLMYNGEISIDYQRGLYHESEEGTGCSDYTSVSFGHPALIIKVKNHTDKTIYLDLKDCFLLLNGETTPLFNPEVKEITNTTVVSDARADSKVSAKSTSVSLSDLFKSSDKEETLAIGVKNQDTRVKATDNVHSTENTNKVVKIKEPVRFVTIPPKASVALDPVLIATPTRSGIFSFDNIYGTMLNRQHFPFTNTCYGQILELNDAMEPLEIGTSMTYSFNQKQEGQHNLRTDLYMKYVLCISSTHGLFPYTINEPFWEQYKFWLPFFVNF